MIDKVITFVIPTRNRQECFRSMLEIFSRFYREKCKLFDVVVLDNSDDNSLEKDVKEFPFNITYIYSEEQLSVVDNFNQGVRYLQGKFACFMGDDDIISERIFDLAWLMLENEIDSAVVSLDTKGIYFWPGIVDARWGRIGGTLYLGESSGLVSPISVEEAIQQCKSKVCDGPQLLPRAYSGLIAKSCIDEVVLRYGALFGGCSPDIFSSRLLSTVVKTHVAVNLPILVAGASKTSTSAKRSERADIGKLKDNDHLGRFHDLTWSPYIPEFYSPFTVWAQSYLQAEEKIGNTLDSRSLAYIYAKCLLFARGNHKIILKSMLSGSGKFFKILLVAKNILILPVFYLIEKMPLLFNRNPGGCNQRIPGLNTSYSAALCLDDRIREIPLRLKCN